ncbi:beta strand repeat-containing protein [Bradyrhizobium sp. HKCCYLR20261]|uniref:beta strand repeat-containing protein n=1 Tax=Bradyrhizobium sp. HKCCYLR20261 TaxID=3420760 RepID=UPI003EBB715C
MANNTFNPTALANGTSNLLVRASALNMSTDLVQAGVVFNDAVRASLGLFTQAGSGNSNPFLGSYTTDLHAVQNDIAAMLANAGQVTLGGQTFTLNATDTAVLTNVQAQLSTLITAAGQTTNAATITAADQTLHAVQQEILQEINGDAHLSGALNGVNFLANTGGQDVAFQNAPAGADDAATLAAATAGNTLKDVGLVFNKVVDLASGGIHTGNLQEITTDLTAISQGLTNILNNKTQLAQIENGETANAAALTTIHLQTVLGQVNLELTQYAKAETTGNQAALRGTADNLLDSIDIIQGDTNLNMAAGGNGTPGHAGGFAEDPGGLTGTVTKFQDNQAQTNFWAAFLAEANTINATLQKISTGGAQASAALVSQIQNYQQFGANFDAAQGAVFRGRFDNELLSGTLEADSAAAVKGLQGILNGDTGAALAADKAMLAAAGQGFAADAMDVSGNNIAIGGATYVGSATTVSTATSVHGLAQGTIPVTATPNIANGTGGTTTTPPSTGGGGTGTGGMHTTPVNFSPTALANGTSNLLTRATAIQHSTDLVQAGVVFNDAVRASLGLFSLANSGNSPAFLTSYQADITAVQTDIAAMLANPGQVTLGGKTFALNATDTAVLTNVEGQLGTLLQAAGQFANATTHSAASQTIHALQQEILGEIHNDAHLANALNNVPFLANTGGQDVAFQASPAGADDPASLAAATAGNSLKDVGLVFNKAVELASGGINTGNVQEVHTDLTAVASGLTAILNNQTQLAQIEAGETANAAALTTIHLQTALGQINLQLNKYDQAATTGNQAALRGTADNLLDIIDIVQGDTNLNVAAGGNGNAGHAGGFAEDPGGLTGTVTRFQDNQAQTNFWAAFLAEANTINATLQKISTGGAQASAALITQIQNYQQFGANFDAAQGAVFQGRFDNELLSGTLEADTAAAVKGLQGILNGDTGAALAADKAMIAAAGQGFAADAMDVSGNNIPVNGGTYVGTATTVSTATSIKGTAQGTIPVTATPNLANGTGGTAAAGTSTAGSAGGGAATGHGGSAAGGTAGASSGGTTAANNGSAAAHSCEHQHHHDHSAGAHTSQAAAAAPDMSQHHALYHMWH